MGRCAPSIGALACYRSSATIGARQSAQAWPARTSSTARRRPKVISSNATSPRSRRLSGSHAHLPYVRTERPSSTMSASRRSARTRMPVVPAGPVTTSPSRAVVDHVRFTSLSLSLRRAARCVPSCAASAAPRPTPDRRLRPVPEGSATSRSSVSSNTVSSSVHEQTSAGRIDARTRCADGAGRAEQWAAPRRRHRAPWRRRAPASSPTTRCPPRCRPRRDGACGPARGGAPHRRAIGVGMGMAIWNDCARGSRATASTSAHWRPRRASSTIPEGQRKSPISR